MSIDKETSIGIIREEISECKASLDHRFDFSEIDSEKLTFTVKLISELDQEVYLLEIQFDDYPMIPLLLEFIHPETGERGSKNSYPQGFDSFFHPFPCICSPCSRKAYQSFLPKAPHGDWEMIGWQGNKQTASLINLKSILCAIYFRINNEKFYQKKRMA